MCMDIFRNASARRRSRCNTQALNRGDSAVCESHFSAKLPTGCSCIELWLNVIPFHDCSCCGGSLLATYWRAHPSGDCLSCHFYLLQSELCVESLNFDRTFRGASAAEGQAQQKKQWENHSVHVGEFCIGNSITLHRASAHRRM